MADTPIDLHPPPETRSEPERLFQPNRSVLGFDSIIPSGPSVPDDYTTSFDLGFDTGEAPYERDCFFCEGGYDDDYVDESMNFGTDLFDSRQPLVDAGDSNWDFDSDGDEDDLAFEYGFGPGSGLRVVDMDSDADSDEFEVNSGIHGGNNIDIAYDDDDDSDGAYIDDVFGINVETIHEDDVEDFEWEEVSERFNLDERDALSSVIDGIQGISVTSDVTSSSEDEIESELDEDDHVRNTEWEVLLAMNNIDRGFNFENPDNVDETLSIVSSAHHIAEDYVLAMEYDALFGQLVENANSNKGSPPASKRAVESLQTVVLKKTDIVEENGCGGVIITCAVCKDEVAVGEKVTKMPCAHLYHGECILPWLKIRNTCPVCRFELPTDDASYEQRRASRVVRDGGDRSGAVLSSGNNNIESMP